MRPKRYELGLVCLKFGENVFRMTLRSFLLVDDHGGLFVMLFEIISGYEILS